MTGRSCPDPTADGPIVRSGPFGQFLMSLVLREGIVLDAVDPATTGGAGDAYTTWTAGPSSCLRLDTRMDTPAQAGVLETALAVRRRATLVRLLTTSEARRSG